MRTALAIVAAGILVLGIAIGAWIVSRPPVGAGDAIAFEQALTPPTTSGTPSISPTTTSPPEDGPPATPDRAVSIPRFTVGEYPEARSRIPVALHIPAIDQDAPIVATGVELSGEMEVPDSVNEVAWYRHGPAPGEPGSAVLAAHVDLAGQGPGVFFRLHELEPGSVLSIDFDDGSSETYRVEARTLYDKEVLPIAVVFSREGPPVLTLITCGGAFDERVRRYDGNVVVYAVPVGDETTS
ncbi:MAG: class F sortase [Acidimicrobiia bacterium]|jgi:LPXTG-site transpeptidase (sortase) family protein